MSLDKHSYQASLPIEQIGQLDRTDELSIEMLVQAYYADVFRLARSILGEEAEAEDIVQETFIAAGSSLASFRGEARIKTWLFGIAVNLCGTQMRKRARHSKLQKALNSLHRFRPRQHSPEEMAVTSERNTRIRDAVQALDEKHRIPVLLHYIHELPVPEIARILDTRPGTVYSRLHYARKKLYHLLSS